MTQKDSLTIKQGLQRQMDRWNPRTVHKKKHLKQPGDVFSGTYFTDQLHDQGETKMGRKRNESAEDLGGSDKDHWSEYTNGNNDEKEGSLKPDHLERSCYHQPNHLNSDTVKAALEDNEDQESVKENN